MARRRSHGDGSLYKRADGRWVGAIDLGVAPNGKRQRKVVYGKTQREAKEKLRAVQRDKDMGTPVSLRPMMDGIGEYHTPICHGVVLVDG